MTKKKNDGTDEANVSGELIDVGDAPTVQDPLIDELNAWCDDSAARFKPQNLMVEEVRAILTRYTPGKVE